MPFFDCLLVDRFDYICLSLSLLDFVCLSCYWWVGVCIVNLCWVFAILLLELFVFVDWFPYWLGFIGGLVDLWLSLLDFVGFTDCDLCLGLDCLLWSFERGCFSLFVIEMLVICVCGLGCRCCFVCWWFTIWVCWFCVLAVDFGFC